MGWKLCGPRSKQFRRWGCRRCLRGDAGVRDVYARAAHPQIVGHALVAAGIGALPLVDLVGAPAVQAKLLHSLATLYGQSWDRRQVSEFLGLLGAGIGASYVARLLGREVIKLIPGWGPTIGAMWGATASGTTTYALGKTAGHYFALAVKRLLSRIDRWRLAALLLWALPVVALLPLGAFWLWQAEALRWWLLAMVACSAAGYGLQHGLLRPGSPACWPTRRPAPIRIGRREPDGAWAAVDRLAEEAKPEDWPLSDGGRMWTLGQEQRWKPWRVTTTRKWSSRCWN
jgi:uncharacterized protein (DUF697 family)